ncbi:hypothetical protein BKA69DRAFT_368065 [Paraphysoderma sedebokerense]|nr:hypothetical protein BKA69DRAFT_368065 [Paraphysoderma sedebokerense]
MAFVHSVHSSLPSVFFSFCGLCIGPALRHCNSIPPGLRALACTWSFLPLTVQIFDAMDIGLRPFSSSSEVNSSWPHSLPFVIPSKQPVCSRGPLRVLTFCPSLPSPRPFVHLIDSVDDDVYSRLLCLEASFCRDFSCCGLVLSDLYELLEHYEECHIHIEDLESDPLLAGVDISTYTSYASYSAASVPSKRQSQQKPVTKFDYSSAKSSCIQTDLLIKKSTQSFPSPPSSRSTSPSPSTCGSPRKRSYSSTFSDDSFDSDNLSAFSNVLVKSGYGGSTCNINNVSFGAETPSARDGPAHYQSSSNTQLVSEEELRLNLSSLQPERLSISHASAAPNTADMPTPPPSRSGSPPPMATFAPSSQTSSNNNKSSLSSQSSSAPSQSTITDIDALIPYPPHLLQPCPETKRYHCPADGCNKSYKNLNGLKYHIGHHHTSPECSKNLSKPHKCLVDGCTKSYTSLGGLKYHMLHAHSHQWEGQGKESVEVNRSYFEQNKRRRMEGGMSGSGSEEEYHVEVE